MSLYLIAFLIGLIVFVLQVTCHVRDIFHGAPSARRDHVKARLAHVLKSAFGQHRVRERWWGKAHVVIFYAFLIFLLGTVELLIACVEPSWMLNQWIGIDATSVLHLIQTYFAWMTLIAVAVIAARRIAKKREVHSTFDAWFILALIAILMLSHITIMGARLALGHEAAWLNSLLPLSHLISGWMPDRQTAWLVHDLSAGIHILAVTAFLVWIPRGKHLHILFAFPNLFLQHRRYDADLKPVYGCDTPDLETYETALEEAIERELPEEQWPVIGATKINQLPRPFLLNAMSCTQCQRCTNVCPMVAANLQNCSGPMASMIQLRTLCKKSDSELVGTEDARMTKDELWHCTQCGACDRACPIGNDHTSRIVELRRGCVCKEDYPSKLNAVFSHMERSGNPWGYAKSDRMKWTAQLHAPANENNNLPRILLFAGCMSSYDAAAQKTLLHCANWLIDQGFSVRVLEKELCCGEPLRKLGKEDEFQKVMASNLAEIEKIPHDVIVTVCPHCAHTLRNEYDGAKKRLHAEHFLTFVSDMFSNGMISIGRTAEKMPSRVVHVPCGLGKTPETPHKLLKLFEAIGLNVIDKDVSQAHCCGAGGGQFLTDNGRDIAKMRVAELSSGHAEEIATACPFCMQMIGDEIVAMNAHDGAKDNLIPMVNVIDICTDCAHGVRMEVVSSKKASE